MSNTFELEYDYFGDNKNNAIAFNAGDSEMLKITNDGFYVRGVKIPQDEKEAEQVYKAFREFLTWTIISNAEN